MHFSKMAFPLKSYLLVETLKEIWEKGWLDEFSEEHFLIKSINGEFPSFRTNEQMNDISPQLYKYGDRSYNFIANFSQFLYKFIELCGEKNAKKFIQDQLSAGKVNYCEDQFFQALHEMQVLRYFTVYGNPNVEYEPKLGGISGEKNPEFRVKNQF